MTLWLSFSLSGVYTDAQLRIRSTKIKILREQAPKSSLGIQTQVPFWFASRIIFPILNTISAVIPASLARIVVPEQTAGQFLSPDQRTVLLSNLILYCGANAFSGRRNDR